MKRWFKYHEDNIIVLSIFLVILVVAGVLVHWIVTPKLHEGMIMNKFVSPIHRECGELTCPTRWIIVIQNGEQKDWWQVSETYFQNVNIGDWVKK